MRGTELVINLSDGVASLVQFERGSRGREVVRRAAQVLPEGLDAAATASHLAGMIADADMAAEWLGVVLDGSDVLVREFAFPFSAASKVERAVQFEMEAGLPCDAVGLAGGVLLNREGKGCRVFSFSLRREALDGMLAALGENGMNPHLVGLDLAALASFAERMPEGSGPACILDVGFGRTLLAALGPDGVCGVARRECGVGKAVDACEGCSRQDVLDGALPGEDVSGPLMAGAVDEMERAARQLALASGVEPARLLLCGVGAHLPGLAQALADRSGLVVEPVWGAAEAGAMGLAEEADPLLVGVLEETGFMGAKRGAALNLRKGEFSRGGDARGAIKRYAWFVAMALLLVVAWGASAVTHGLEGRRALEAGEARINQLFHQAAPDAQGNFSRTQMFSILQTRIDRLKGRQDMGGGRPQLKAIEAIRALNTAAPAGLDVQVDALTLGDTGGRIQGTARDFQTVNTFLEGLASGGVLADVRIVVASAVQKTGRVRYELEYVRK